MLVELQTCQCAVERTVRWLLGMRAEVGSGAALGVTAPIWTGGTAWLLYTFDCMEYSVPGSVYKAKYDSDRARHFASFVNCSL